jgi:putative ABC transport system ATP-binding protein
MIDGHDLGKMGERQIIQIRRSKIGFVYQTFGLLPFLSAGENVEVPLRMVRTPRKEREERVRSILELVGLGKRINHRTYELSGGEQQRVAVARALINRPSMLLADEPTGQLDTTTGMGIMDMLSQVSEQLGVTVLIASHDPNMTSIAQKVIELQDGKLVSEGAPKETPTVPEGAAHILKQAIALLKGGRKTDAQQVLVELLRRDATQDQAWYLLSFAVQNHSQQTYALEQALLVNPRNAKASVRLSELLAAIPDNKQKPGPFKQ